MLRAEELMGTSVRRFAYDGSSLRLWLDCEIGEILLVFKEREGNFVVAETHFTPKGTL
jgi:hypothetical protein